MKPSERFIDLSYAVNCLETDWLAVKYNLAYFKSLLDPHTKLLVMLKSDAYGNGDWQMALKMEEEHLVDYIAVFHLSEGILLREKGVSIPIMVMDHHSIDLSIYEKCQLEVVIYRVDQLIAFAEFNKLHQNSLKGHLKFNTGMNRLGIDPVNIDAVINVLSSNLELPIASILTHLSSTRLPEQDDFTLQQMNCFEDILAKIEPFLPEHILKHVLNSHGIVRFPQYHYDMVRLGIGAYGGSDHEELINNLKPIAKLTTEISDLRKLSKGASISYDQSGKLEQEGTIVSIPIGYDDGLPRNLSNGNWEVEINGKLYPIIGNVCMNLTMVNLGEDTANIGDRVIIFGGKKSIFDFAAAIGTISYEAMSNIGSKVVRKLVNA